MISYVHIPKVPQMQERSETERRATTGPAAGFDEGRPGRAQSAQEAERLGHTNNFFASFYIDFNLGDFN